MVAAASREELRGHLALAGFWAPSAAALGALLLFLLGVHSQQHVGHAAAAWLLLLALVFVELRQRLQARLSASDGEQLDPQPRSGAWGALVTIWTLLGGSLALGARAIEPARSPGLALLATALIAVAAVCLGLVGYYRALGARPGLRDVGLLVPWLYATVVVCLGATALAAAIHLGWSSSAVSIEGLFATLVTVPGVEWIVRTLLRDSSFGSLLEGNSVAWLAGWFTRQRTHDREPVRHRHLADSLSRPWSRAWRPWRSLSALALLAWLCTAVVIVPPLEAGLVERMGRPVSREWMRPGLHFKAPWPIDELHRFDVARSRAMLLGYAGEVEDASLLWTKSHAQEEYDYLIGDGRELLTIHAVLQYRVSDPWAWHYAYQNPESVLRACAEQALLRATVDLSMTAALSGGSAGFSARLEARIREEVVRQGLGVSVVSLSLLGLHPPMAVAADYQAITSAHHESKASALEAEAYAIERLSRARASVESSRARSLAQQSEAVHRAVGKAAAFAALAEARRASPESFQRRLRLEALEEALAGRALQILDDRIEGGGGTVWIR